MPDLAQDFSNLSGDLLNEFIKEHKAFVSQQHPVEQLQATTARQQKQIETFTASLQKVNDKIELREPAGQTVLNNH